MGRLNKLTSRVLACSAMVAGASVLAQGPFIETAHAATNISCLDASLKNPVFISGSSAVKPVLASLAAKLSSSVTIVYISPGSCAGVQAVLGTPAAAQTWTYWTPNATAGGAPVVNSCDTTTTQAVDIGVSDVFATTCPSVTTAQLTAAGVSDFDTYFNEVMEFVVPAASDAHSISAEAAYLTFGFGANGATRWNNEDLLLVRNQNSGTQILWSTVLKLPVTKWLGHDEGGSGQVVKDITNVTDPITAQAGNPQLMLGIVSSAEADADTVDIKKLSFQDYGQTCAFWPDSGVSAKDKKYVRDGHYPAWGPAHWIAKATNGVPANTSVKTVLDAFGAQSQDVLDSEINNHVVPICAMNVTRDAEIGPLSSFQPTGSCGCYFDKQTTGTTTCDVCTGTGASTCTGGKVCNYGYCEAK